MNKLKVASSISYVSKYFLRKVEFVAAALVSSSTVYSCSPMTFDFEFEPDDPRLRSSECLKNAAGIAVDASSAVLSQTVYALQNIEKEYKQLIEALTELTAAQVTAMVNQHQDNVVADVVMETRQEIEKVKKRKQDLEILFSSAEKLCDATAEVAFASGMTFASTSIGERLHTAQQEIRRLQAVSSEAQKRLDLITVRLIEETGKQAEKIKNEDDQDGEDQGSEKDEKNDR